MKNPFHHSMIAAFCNWYNGKKGVKYDFKPVDARKIDDIYNRLIAYWNAKNPGKVPQTLEFITYFQHFLDKIPELHPWLYNNLDLKTLESKTQVLLASIISGNKVSQPEKSIQTRLNLLDAITNGHANG